MTHDSAIRPPLRGWPGSGCTGLLVALGGGLYSCAGCGHALILDSDTDQLLGVYPSSMAALIAARQFQPVAAEGGAS